MKSHQQFDSLSHLSLFARAERPFKYLVFEEASAALYSSRSLVLFERGAYIIRPVVRGLQP